MGQAASSGTKKLPTANDVRALLFGGRVATLTTPISGAVSTLVFKGTVQQLQGELALTYKVTKELTQRPPTLVRRRKQLAMDDDAEELLIVAATCSLGDAKMTVLTDEPMCACVDVFDDDVRVHFVSPTNPELGGVVVHRKLFSSFDERRRSLGQLLPDLVGQGELALELLDRALKHKCGDGAGFRRRERG